MIASTRNAFPLRSQPGYSSSLRLNVAQDHRHLRPNFLKPLCRPTRLRTTQCSAFRSQLLTLGLAKRHQLRPHLLTAIINTVFDLLSAFARIEPRYSLYHHVKYDGWNESWDRRGGRCGDTSGSCYSGLGSHLHAKQKSSFNPTARQAASERHLRNGSVTLSNRMAADLCDPVPFINLRIEFSLDPVRVLRAHLTAVSLLLLPALPYPEMPSKQR